MGGLGGDWNLGEIRAARPRADQGWGHDFPMAHFADQFDGVFFFSLYCIGQILRNPR